jgi:hypothetical protein
MASATIKNTGAVNGFEVARATHGYLAHRAMLKLPKVDSLLA